MGFLSSVLFCESTIFREMISPAECLCALLSPVRQTAAYFHSNSLFQLCHRHITDRLLWSSTLGVWLFCSHKWAFEIRHSTYRIDRHGKNNFIVHLTMTKPASCWKVQRKKRRWVQRFLSRPPRVAERASLLIGNTEIKKKDAGTEKKKALRGRQH